MGCCGNGPSALRQQYTRFIEGEEVMRPSCILCAIKHICQARALLLEARKGYYHHYWFAMGHLAEAEDELALKFSDYATVVREHRIHLEADRNFFPPFEDLIALLGPAIGVEKA